MMGGKIDSWMQLELTEFPEKEDTRVGTRFNINNIGKEYTYLQLIQSLLVHGHYTVYCLSKNG